MVDCDFHYYNSILKIAGHLAMLHWGHFENHGTTVTLHERGHQWLAFFFQIISFVYGQKKMWKKQKSFIHSIIFSALFFLFRVVVDLEPIPGRFRMRKECTRSLDFDLEQNFTNKSHQNTIWKHQKLHFHRFCCCNFLLLIIMTF